MLEWLKRKLGVGDYARDFGALRSDKWPLIRAAHLVKEPCCQVCGGKKNITVHHVQPFHLHPELELDPTNLVTLCEGAGSGNHHLIFGHFGNYRSKFNPTIVEEAPIWLARFAAVGNGVDPNTAGVQ